MITATTMMAIIMRMRTSRVVAIAQVVVPDVATGGRVEVGEGSARDQLKRQIAMLKMVKWLVYTTRNCIVAFPVLYSIIAYS